MLFTLAWRNIWRNKRRTLITAASVFFAVFLSALMQSIQSGTWNHMLNNVVNYYIGFAQVHADGYWENRSINDLMTYDPQKVSNIESLVDVVPRLESFALASVGEQTKGVMLVGIDPVKENSLTRISERIVEGTMIENEGLLVGEGLKEILNFELGDTIILLSQGYHGANAANLYPVKGIVHFASPELNKQFMMLPLKQARDFFATDPDHVSAIVMNISNQEDVPQVINQLKEKFQEGYEVMDWQEMMPELVEAKEIDTAGSNIMLIILYLIITFGIFGTILMMTKDREHEFGILISIGMQRWKLIIMVWLEVIMISFVGVLAGIVVSMPLLKYLQLNPIKLTGQYADAYETFGMEPLMVTEFAAYIFIVQGLIVFLITSILALYPIISIKTLKPVKAMKG